MFAPMHKNYIFKIKQKGRGNKRNNFHLKKNYYSQIISSDFEFTFNLRGEIKTIRGLTPKWPHPFEFLKRTEGNDWVFYTVGTNSTQNGGIISWFGEYYFPCLQYPSNSFWEYNPFGNENVMIALASWSQLYADLYSMSCGPIAPDRKKFIDLVLKNNDLELLNKSKQLNKIIGEEISVLPPECRSVDYEAVPLVISNGCLYKCGFCMVKNKQKFSSRSCENIDNQIKNLKDLYGDDLINFNSVFLGNHDALASDFKIIKYAVSKSLKEFGFFEKQEEIPKFFMFGSADSFLNSDEETFKFLNQTPALFYINIGFESFDEKTLKQIRKPINASKVDMAFKKMLMVNKEYSNIEVSGNFLIGSQLNDSHYESVCGLLNNIPHDLCKKGSIYLSPLIGESDTKSKIIQYFNLIKEHSCLPVYIYLIQRL